MLLVAMVTTRYFFAQQVSNSHVFGFDIQDTAINQLSKSKKHLIM